MTEAHPEQPPPGSVDARFTLAAERTVLAWVRTALGMIAAGVAVLHVPPSFASTGLRELVGIGLIVVGALSAVVGGFRWRQTSIALARGGTMPGPAAVWLVIVALVALSGIVLVATLVE